MRRLLSNILVHYDLKTINSVPTNCLIIYNNLRRIGVQIVSTISAKIVKHFTTHKY